MIRATPKPIRYIPRRARRGLSALVGVLLVSIGLSAGFAGWQASMALSLRDAHLTGLEHWVRSEAQALHHWTHAQPGHPVVGTARALMPAERNGLAAYRLTGRQAPDGWHIDHLMSTPVAQANHGIMAHGLLVISSDVLAMGALPSRVTRRRAEWLLHGLCARLSSGTTYTAAAAEGLAARLNPALDFGGSGCDAHSIGVALAVFAAPLAGIDARLVLREPRAGFAPADFTADLDMGGHDIHLGMLASEAMTGAMHVTAAQSRLGDLETIRGGGLDVTGALAAQNVEIAGTTVFGPGSAFAARGDFAAVGLTVTGAMDVRGKTNVGTGGCTGCPQ